MAATMRAPILNVLHVNPIERTWERNALAAILIRATPMLSATIIASILLPAPPTITPAGAIAIMTIAVRPNLAVAAMRTVMLSMDALRRGAKQALILASNTQAAFHVLTPMIPTIPPLQGAILPHRHREEQQTTTIPIPSSNLHGTTLPTHADLESPMPRLIPAWKTPAGIPTALMTSTLKAIALESSAPSCPLSLRAAL